PFDGGNLPAIRLDRKEAAGLDGLAIEVNCAGAAMSVLASNVGASQAQDFAQAVDQEHPGLDYDLMIHAIHLERNLLTPHNYAPGGACSGARLSARMVSSRARSRLYSTEPRKSAPGSDASAASCAARL